MSDRLTLTLVSILFAVTALALIVILNDRDADRVNLAVCRETLSVRERQPDCDEAEHGWHNAVDTGTRCLIDLDVCRQNCR